MICEAFRLANAFVLIPGKDGELRKMSECPEDFHAYWKLGEYILRQIENSYEKHADLENARCLIQRIRRRDLFTCAGETIMTPALRARLASVGLGYKEKDVKKQLLELLEKKQGDDKLIEEADVFCQIVKIGYGKGNINPVSTFTAFYEPDKTRENFFDCKKYGTSYYLYFFNI